MITLETVKKNEMVNSLINATDRCLDVMNYTEHRQNYILARKSAKLYMTNPIRVEIKSITTLKVQSLYIDEIDEKRINGKIVLKFL